MKCVLNVAKKTCNQFTIHEEETRRLDVYAATVLFSHSSNSRLSLSVTIRLVLLYISFFLNPGETPSLICVQCAEGARSPAVFAAIVSYIRDVLDVFGIELLHSTVRVCAGKYSFLALNSFHRSLDKYMNSIHKCRLHCSVYNVRVRKT